MKVIVGLGNPGRKYQSTRHNIGFDVVAAIAEHWGERTPRTRFDAETIESVRDGEKVMLVCPQTYMNRSGQSVRAVADFYKLDPEDFLIISDDLNLPRGRMRMRAGGSAGGQKGLADIIRHFGTDRVARLRLGIDRPPPGYAVVDYVLGHYTEEEIAELAPVVKTAAEAACFWAKCGIADAMNRYNAAPESKSSKKRRSAIDRDIDGSSTGGRSSD